VGTGTRVPSTKEFIISDSTTEDYMRPLRSMHRTLVALRLQQKLLKSAGRFDEDLWCRITVLALDILRRQRALAKACQPWFQIEPARPGDSRPAKSLDVECPDAATKPFNASLEWRFAAEKDKRLRLRAARALVD
jgi:hypothetical protein